MKPHQLFEEDLFLIMIRGNDIIDTVVGESQAKLREAVEEKRAITTLSKTKVKHIIVAGAPNLEVIPAFFPYTTPSASGRVNPSF